jgi:hypothetical protein
MKKLSLTVVLLLLAVSGATAQNAKKLNVYLGTGGALPTGDFNIKYNAGINGFVGLGISVGKNVDLIPKIEFQSLAIDPFAFADTITGGNYTGMYVGVDARYAVQIPRWFFRPNAQVGLGLAFSHFDQLIEGDIVTLAHSTTDIYGSIGIGFDFPISGSTKAFFLARYTRISNGPGKMEIFPFTAGIRF